MIAIVSNPKAFKIPDWFLNRQRDWKTGKASQATSNVVDTKLREDLERLKKVRCVGTDRQTEPAACLLACLGGWMGSLVDRDACRGWNPDGWVRAPNGDE